MCRPSLIEFASLVSKSIKLVSSSADYFAKKHKRADLMPDCKGKDNISQFLYLEKSDGS